VNQRRVLRDALLAQQRACAANVLSLSALLASIATVVVLSAVYTGAERRVVERVRAMGTNLLMIQAAPARIVVGRTRQRSMVTTLRPGDAALVAEGTSLSHRAAAAVIRQVVARWKGGTRQRRCWAPHPKGSKSRDSRRERARVRRNRGAGTEASSS
jgi:hypothetical protein